MSLVNGFFIGISVYFGCGNGLVPQYFLEYDRWHASLSGIAAKGMPPGMRIEFLVLERGPSSNPAEDLINAAIG